MNEYTTTCIKVRIRWNEQYMIKEYDEESVVSIYGGKGREGEGEGEGIFGDEEMGPTKQAKKSLEMRKGDPFMVHGCVVERVSCIGQRCDDEEGVRGLMGWEDRAGDGMWDSTRSKAKPLPHVDSSAALAPTHARTHATEPIRVGSLRARWHHWTVPDPIIRDVVFSLSLCLSLGCASSPACDLRFPTSQVPPQALITLAMAGRLLLGKHSKGCFVKSWLSEYQIKACNESESAANVAIPEIKGVYYSYILRKERPRIEYLVGFGVNIERNWSNRRFPINLRKKNRITSNATEFLYEEQEESRSTSVASRVSSKRKASSTATGARERREAGGLEHRRAEERD
ncbi:hypothetical protein BHE74_00025935 [Ensete ventricosum]|nr:hypothetical protein BHE74_00025935 [Ensete ventricosum]